MDPEIQRLQKQIDELKMQQSLQGQGVNFGISFKNLFDGVEVVDAAPSEAPFGNNVYEQIKLFYNSTGPVMRLYIYDNVNGNWNYVALTIV